MLRFVGFSPHGGAIYNGIKPIVEPDQVLGWRLSPGIHQYGQSPSGEDIIVSITDYHSRAVAPDDPRRLQPTISPKALFFTGDSFTFGSELFSEQTFPWLIRQHLETQSPGVTGEKLSVYNYGTIGYGTCQSYMLMKSLINSRASYDSTGSAIFVYGLSSFHEERNIAPPGYLWRIARSSASNSASMPWCDLDANGELVLHPPDIFTVPAGIVVDHLALGTLAAEAYFFWKGRDRVSRQRIITKAILRRMKLEADRTGNKFIVFLQSFSPVDRADYLQFFTEEKIASITGDLLPREDPGVLAIDGHHPGPVQAERWAEQLARELNSPNILGKEAPN